MDNKFKRYAVAAGALLILLKIRKMLEPKIKRKRRKYKIRRPIDRNRFKFAFFKQYFLPMKKKDKFQFFQYTRMNVPVFEELLRKVTPIMERNDSYHPISSEERLAITLHFLSQGSSMQTIAWKYHVGLNTVNSILRETCDTICEVLKEYLKVPDTNEEWLDIADGFAKKCDFPNCIGALDGKHIAMKAPQTDGSPYCRCKNINSMVLMAACNSDLLFTMLDIGVYGSCTDARTWGNSAIGKKFSANEMNLPEPASLPEAEFNIKFPYCLAANAAFPLTNYIIRPYTGNMLTEVEENFNRRLSRARRTIENAFGILSYRWRILLTTINGNIDLVEKIIKTTVHLHNFLKVKLPSEYCPSDFLDRIEERNRNLHNTIPPNALKSVSKVAINDCGKGIKASARRDSMAFYLFSEGIINEVE